ncbi:hypothetical protein EJ02DRAFT_469283 [Clathrospora elynae]|uniref:Uncharacterized protein n=1 Tax=Clathrospora elynae TaxID=706981 RepID=A0A6A5SEJ1_9PLEO|nr:hypothetical protein EJ02DRAFT_469283 [Clathrospora elynae]
MIEKATVKTSYTTTPTYPRPIANNDLARTDDMIPEPADEDRGSLPQSATKRKRGADTPTTGDTPYSRETTAPEEAQIKCLGDGETFIPPAKKRKTAPSSPNYNYKVAIDDATDEGRAASSPKTAAKSKKVYTDAEISAFEHSIHNIQDWSSKDVSDKYVEFIHWFDVDGLTLPECGVRFVAKRYAKLAEGKTTTSDANMYKHYKTWAPRFYREKGVEWVARGARKAYHQAKGNAGPADIAVPEDSPNPASRIPAPAPAKMSAKKLAAIPKTNKTPTDQKNAERKRRWEIQQAFWKKEEEVKKKQQRVRFASRNEAEERRLIQAPLHDYYDEDDDESNNAQSTDSSDTAENPWALIVALPIEYAQANRRVASDDGHFEDAVDVHGENLTNHSTSDDRTLYRGEGLNQFQDVEVVARKKMAIVQRKLAEFRSAGYNIGLQFAVRYKEGMDNE